MGEDSPIEGRKKGKPRGRPFTKATRPPAHRRKGTPNKVTKEGRELARGLIQDETYLAKLKKRLSQGRASNLEQTLWYYAFGKPKEIHAFDPEQLRQVVGALLGVQPETLPLPDSQ